MHTTSSRKTKIEIPTKDKLNYQNRTGTKSNMEVTGRPVWLVVQKRPWPAPVQRMVRSIKRETEKTIPFTRTIAVVAPRRNTQYPEQLKFPPDWIVKAHFHIITIQNT